MSKHTIDVVVNGEVIKSCLSLAVQANGKSVTTIEGLSCEGELHPVQDAFLNCGGMQCGYCTPRLHHDNHSHARPKPQPV